MERGSKRMEQPTNNPLSQVAIILRKYITPNGESETYEIALQSIVNNIFNIVKCYELLSTIKDINAEDLHLLYETLKTLDGNKYVKLTNEQEENIRKTPLYNQIVKSINSKIDELNPGKEVEKLKRQLDEKVNTFINDELYNHIYEII